LFYKQVCEFGIVEDQLMRKTLLISGLAAALMTTLGATPALADHDRRVVIRETIYAAPALAYRSGPISVYYGASRVARHPSRFTTKVITTSHRTASGHSPYRHDSRHDSYRYDAHRHDAYGQRSYGQGSYGHGSSRHDGYGHRASVYGHAPTRGSWSRDRREVIYVDKDARRSSSYRRVERNSAVIRERRR